MEFIRSKLPRSFMDKEYKEHQKGALLVEAEANLGDLQEDVKRKIQLEEIEKLTKDLKAEKKKVEAEIQKIKKDIWEKKMLGYAFSQEATIQKELQIQKKDIHESILETLRNVWRINMDGAEPYLQNKEKVVMGSKFFMACPSVKECRGRLSTSYKCGLCAHYFCPDCHGDKGLEMKNEEHTCKEDDVKTVELLKKNTRHCPKCQMGIFKTQGCDQMWCTQCHTCFSWKSGNILNGAVHNPHFYEWQRQQNGGVAPRVLGDILCGGIPPLWHLHRKSVGEPYELLARIHRLVSHLNGDTMERALGKMNNRRVVQRESGIQYLRNLIDKETWVNTLYRSNRDAEKYRRYHQVLETLVFNISEIFRVFLYSEDLTPMKAVENCEKVLQFANDEIRRMNKQFKSNFKILNIQDLEEVEQDWRYL